MHTPPDPDSMSRLTLNPLEDRVTPAPLPPTITDPAATVRVDQDAYTILGHLAAPARDGTEVRVYADSNHNGVFNPGIDALTASTPVPQGDTDFSVAASLRQNAANRFFAVAADPTGRSGARTVPLIVEDSTPPTVTRVAFLGPVGPRAEAVQCTAASPVVRSKTLPPTRRHPPGGRVRSTACHPLVARGWPPGVGADRRRRA